MVAWEHVKHSLVKGKPSRLPFETCTVGWPTLGSERHVLICSLAIPSALFTVSFLGEGSPTKIDRDVGILIQTSPEDLAKHLAFYGFGHMTRFSDVQKVITFNQNDPLGK